MTERLTIDHVGQRGDGVAVRDACNVFVPGALPGETVDVAELPGHPDRRRLLHIERPSLERIAPFCPVFGRCGGCAIQHWDLARYSAWKRDLVVQALEQAGIETEVAELVDAHGAGRRRAIFHARRSHGGPVSVGFAAAGSHEIIPIDDCPVLDPSLDGALDAARALAEALAPVNKPLDLQVTATSNGLDIDIRGSGALDPRVTAKLAQLGQKLHVARLTRHGELTVLVAPPTIRIGKTLLALPAGSFLQPTVAGELALSNLVIAHCNNAKSVIDLFCGVGPFALRLAERSRVSAFDSDDNAVASLQKAVSATSGLKPLQAERRDLFRRPLMPFELNDAQAIVFDPPRQGAQAQAKEIARSRVPTVVAVSCDIATFTRDARILIDGGYKIGTVTPVDQFRHTPHVELVACFKRK